MIMNSLSVQYACARVDFGDVFEKGTQQSVVSIYGPLGYGPSTLPLRHSAPRLLAEVKMSFVLKPGLLVGFLDET